METWTEMPRLLEESFNFQSGIVNQSDGSKSIMIVGGNKKSSSELFDFQTNSWTKKADLPYQLNSGSTLPYKDSFIIIGGFIYESWRKSKSILYYDPLLDRWETLKEELNIPRQHFAAFYVPNYFC